MLTHWILIDKFITILFGFEFHNFVVWCFTILFLYSLVYLIMTLNDIICFAIEYLTEWEMNIWAMIQWSRSRILSRVGELIEKRRRWLFRSKNFLLSTYICWIWFKFSSTIITIWIRAHEICFLLYNLGAVIATFFIVDRIPICMCVCVCSLFGSNNQSFGWFTQHSLLFIPLVNFNRHSTASNQNKWLACARARARCWILILFGPLPQTMHVWMVLNDLITYRVHEIQ